MRPSRTVLAVFGVILVLRLASVAVMASRGFTVSPVQDPLEYRLIALNVLEYGTFSIFPAEQSNPDLLRGPGYPLFLAATFLIERSGYLAAALQQVMAVGAALLTFSLLRRFGLGRVAALVGGAAVALEPMSWFISLTTWSETLAGFLIAAATAAAASARPFEGEAGIRRALVVGLALGAAILVRPTTAAIAPFLVLPLLADKTRPFRARLLTLVLACLLVTVLVAPWIARNRALTGRWLLSASYAFNLVQGMGEKAEYEAVRESRETIVDARGRSVPNFEAFSLRGHARLRELADGLERREGLPRLIGRQVAHAPTVWFGHDYDTAVGIVFGSRMESFGPAVESLDDILWAAILLLALIGSVVLIRRSVTRVLVTALAVVVILGVVLNVCQAYARMLVPLYPLIALFATMGAIEIRRKLWPTSFSPSLSSSTAPPTSS